VPNPRAPPRAVAPERSRSPRRRRPSRARGDPKGVRGPGPGRTPGRSELAPQGARPALEPGPVLLPAEAIMWASRSGSGQKPWTALRRTSQAASAAVHPVAAARSGAPAVGTGRSRCFRRRARRRFAVRGNQRRSAAAIRPKSGGRRVTATTGTPTVRRKASRSRTLNPPTTAPSTRRARIPSSEPRERSSATTRRVPSVPSTRTLPTRTASRCSGRETITAATGANRSPRENAPSSTAATRGWLLPRARRKAKTPERVRRLR
jgi:hypothetical protein